MSVTIRVEKPASGSSRLLFGVVRLDRQELRRWDGTWRVVVTPGGRAIGVGGAYQYWRTRYHHDLSVSEEQARLDPAATSYLELWETTIEAGGRGETLVLHLDRFGFQTFITGDVQIHLGPGRLRFSDHGDFRGAVRWNTVVSASP